MSLKAFHILFIVASTILSCGFGIWAIRHSLTGESGPAELGLGVASIILGIGLIWYGRFFLRKLKHISYL
jgi:hypothetical protein